MKARSAPRAVFRLRSAGDSCVGSSMSGAPPSTCAALMGQARNCDSRAATYTLEADAVIARHTATLEETPTVDHQWFFRCSAQQLGQLAKLVPTSHEHHGIA